MSRPRVTKSNDFNQWPPPVVGHDFDILGPNANYLIDASHIYDQVVYQDIRPSKEEWSIVNETEAEDYLPKRKEPLKVTVGIEEKKTPTLSMLDSIRLDDHFEYKRGYLINTGGSIWGLDFAPKCGSDDNDPTTQYLAVSGFRGAVDEHITMDTIQPTGSYKNAIQIWKLKLSVERSSESAELDMCLLHDYGVVYDLKWCPYGTFESQGGEGEELYKLGILSFACGDATIRTIVVPHPDAVRKHMHPGSTDSTKTVYLRIESSRCTFSLKTSVTTKIAWGGHKKLACASSSGAAHVWDMESALHDKNASIIEKSRRHLSFSSTVLDSGARDVTWRGVFEPEKLLVSGSDGQLMLIDISDPFIPFPIPRVRGVLGACGWAGHSPLAITFDADNTTKGISFQLDGSVVSSRYNVTPGFCWSIGTSEHHGFFAMSTSTGWVKTLNVYVAKVRSFSNTMNIVYKLNYNEDTQTYRYIDGMVPQPLDNPNDLAFFQQYSDTHMAIHRVVWNPNKLTSGFVASGGAAGLCRIDFEGKGSNWT